MGQPHGLIQVEASFGLPFNTPPKKGSAHLEKPPGSPTSRPPTDLARSPQFWAAGRAEGIHLRCHGLHQGHLAGRATRRRSGSAPGPVHRYGCGGHKTVLADPILGGG